MLITEFVASNDDSLSDEDGESPDWIEILNAGNEPVNLEGWHLTDDANDLNKWEFPSVDVSPGQYQMVFASGKDRDSVGGELHTNFRLSSGGEYLALTRPDESIAFEYAPTYPQQVEDIGYGIPSAIVLTSLIEAGATAELHVPTDGSLDPDLANEQTENSFVDPALNTSGAAWADVTTGVGYWDESIDPNPKPGDGTIIADSAADFSGSQGADSWRYGTWNATDDSDGVYDFSSSDFRAMLNVPAVGFLNTWNTSEGYWDLSVRTSNPQDAILRADGAKPSGTNSGDEAHTMIRRWEAEITGGILIHGTINNPDASGDGVVATILVDGEEIYSESLNGNSKDYQTIIQVDEGQRIDFMLSPGAAGDDVGDDTLFSTFVEDVTALVGNQNGVPTLTPAISTDIEADVKGIGSSAYLRVPFEVTTTDFDALTLNLKYQDGFVAYINGQVVAFDNSPDPIDAAWNSTSTGERSVEEALEYVSFSASSAIDLLNVGGDNVLAIHGINVSTTDDDFLIVPELIGTKLEINETDIRYFPTATPNSQNGLGVEEVGPLVTNNSHTPTQQPTTSESIVVTTNLTETFAPVSSVTLHYRVMYGNTTDVAMNDNGTGADAVAGDGVYSAMIPSDIGQPGEMIRWYVTADDTSGNETRSPGFVDDDSEEYFGTVYLDPELASLNPELVMFQTFFENPTRKNTDGGTYGSIFYNNEFYDHVRFDLHGQSSRGFPKKSLDVNFPEDHRFNLRDDFPRYKKFNLLSNYADKAKMRNPLAWETRRLTGVPSAYSTPVLVYENGSFFQLADLVEDADDRFLERNGLDPDNTVYKIYNTFNSASGAEKKTNRDDSEGDKDLVDFIDGISSNTGTARTNFFYDNVDLAGMANYLAGFTVTSNTDCCHKNFYAYRDTNGSGEWSFLPWDVDLSYGRKWGGFGLSYHDYTIYADNPLFMGGNNNLISKLYAVDSFEEMYLRRIRTIMDEIYGPPEGDNKTIEDYVDKLKGQIGDWGQEDLDKWGQVSSGNQAQPFETWEVAVNKILDDYLEPRREWLYNTQTVPEPNGGGEDPVLVFEGNAVQSRYLVPGDNSINGTWANQGFNDNSWTVGQFGYGFENSPADFADDISTTVKPIDVVSGATTIMTRTEFDLTDIANIDKMTLNMKYDDGFVAYINGTEVARAGVAGDVNWNSTSGSHADSAAVQFVPFAFDIDDLTLFESGNVLAVQIVNATPTSSDMLLDVDLYTGEIAVTSSTAPIPVAQRADATIDVGMIDFNPVSGNQDEEYIELVNNSDTAIDISGWELNGAVDMTFRPGTVIIAGGSLYVTPDSNAFRARTTGPTGGQGLFVQDGMTGHLSNFGETINIVRGDGSLANSTTYEGNPTPVQESLRITELMYNPLGPDFAEQALSDLLVPTDFEFAELTNTGPTTLDLTGVKFTSGVQFDFTDSNVTSLAAGERVVVVRDQGAFSTRYGIPASQIAGEFSGSLSDGGESIKIEDSTNSTVQEFSYNDNRDTGWSDRADGRGSSLQIIDVTGDYGSGSNWQSSSEINGTPGSDAGSFSPGIVINEVLTNSTPPTVDSIELLNVSGASISLNDYYLSDSAMHLDTLQLFSLPDVTLASGEYVVFTETDFNPGGGGNLNDFALSSFGDQVYLTVGNGSKATHFSDFANFGAITTGESYGRFPNATGPLVPMISNSFGAENGSPRIGPVIISELNYNPGEPTAADLAIDPTIEENDLEFIEVHNTSASTIDLSDWRIRGGADIDFDPASTLAAGETAVVISWNPDNPANVDRLTAFRGHYGIDSSVRLIGGYSNRLDDGGERVTLQRPGTAPIGDPTNIPRLLEDEVLYSDSAPWTADADGTGNSLTRASASGLGNASTSWFAAAPTPGTVDLGNVPGDVNQDGVVDAGDIDRLFVAINAGDNNSTFDLDNSGSVTSDDVTYLVETILGTCHGDADLDGKVDVRDLNTVGINWQTSGNGWSQGDFNGDGMVSSIDLNSIGINWQKGVALAARTPRAALAARAIPAVELEVAHRELESEWQPSNAKAENTLVESNSLHRRRRGLQSQQARRQRVDSQVDDASDRDFASLADGAFENWNEF